MSRTRVLMAMAWAAAIAALPRPGPAADWPQWRGTGRDGIATAAVLPDRWPAGQLKPLWQTPVGEGYSGPVIVAGSVYTHWRQAGREVIGSFEAATGRPGWRYQYPAPYQVNPAAKRHGPGPKATTTVADGRVYAFGISSILTCLDAATGKLIWQRDLKVDFQAGPAEYGTAASPLVCDRLVVVPVGGKRGGSVMAFHADTGKLAWKAVPGELPAMSSPIVADLAGTRQVITFTEKHFVGLDLPTGRVLWSYPFTTAYRMNIVTPVVVGDTVIASGYMKYAFALRPRRTPDGMVASELWKNRDLRCFMSSPVCVNGYLYGQGARGELVCVNAKTGKTAWSGGNFDRYCSIVAAGDRLLVLDNTGKLTVLKASPDGYQELAKMRVSDQQTWAHLALVGSRIYVRDSSRLMCFDLKAQ